MQGVERLGGELDRPAVGACGQPTLRGMESEVAELVDALNSRAFSHFPPVSQRFRRSQAGPKASSGLLVDSRPHWIRANFEENRSTHMTDTTSFLASELTELGLMAAADPHFAERL